MIQLNKADISELVTRVLEEDVGSGDLTAALVPGSAIVDGRVVARETMVLAGQPFVDAVFDRLDPSISIDWRAEDGDEVAAGEALFSIRGPARAILTGERAALNILQTLCATATTTAAYVRAVEGTGCRILDTRKTLPGLRAAQKYAVRAGGGTNHRFGLYDAVLIKENHILAAGSIAAAVRQSRELHAGIAVETEVETLDELDAALDAGVERVLLDNFSNADLRRAVSINAERGAGRAELEASGNVELDTVRGIAETGVDFISIGALTKHVRAIDLSMRFDG